MNCRRTAVLSIPVGLCAFVAGCGRVSEIARLPVRGAVTLPDGEKLNGSVTFLPVGGHGPAATTSVKDGSYQFDQSNGPTAGPNRVIVRRVIPKSAMLESRANGKSKPPKETSPGPEPRKEWTLSVDVTDQNFGRCDLKLEP